MKILNFILLLLAATIVLSCHNDGGSAVSPPVKDSSAIGVQHYHAIKIYLWDPDLTAKYPALFGKDEPLKRDFQEIVVTGNLETDRIKIEFAQVRIREIYRIFYSQISHDFVRVCIIFLKWVWA